MVKKVAATTKNLRMSPFKVRAVANQVRNMPLSEARAYLGLSQKKAAQYLLKTINSAVANATHNSSMPESELKLLNLQIGEANTYRKPKYRARGRMDIMRTTFSHIFVEVGMDFVEEKVVKTEKTNQVESPRKTVEEDKVTKKQEKSKAEKE